MITQKWQCKVCGYIHTGDSAPAACPVCYASTKEFSETSAEGQMTLAQYLEANIEGETWEVTKYLAMALKAEWLGLGEVSATLHRIAEEEAYHGKNFIFRASHDNDLKKELKAKNKLAENLKSDMEAMLAGERGAHKGKNEAAALASAQGKTELAGFFRIAAQDESRHAKVLEGLLKRYF